MEQQTNFSDLPNYEKVRALGQTTVQVGFFMIAISTVLKQLGKLPESVVRTTVFKETESSQFDQQNNYRGYFD